MPSKIDVINVALRRVGADSITALTDNQNEAFVADDVYDNVLDSMLRAHNWNFATKRVQLAQITAAPSFEFDHAYALPADWLRTISVHPDDRGVGRLVYRMENHNGQRSILASADEVYLRYIALETDPNLWSADFRDVISFALARDFAIPLASSNKLYSDMDVQLRKALASARSTDAMGQSPEFRPRGTWVTRRGRSRPIVGEASSSS